MLLDLDQGRLWVFLIGLALFALLEALWPAGRRLGPRALRWLRHGTLAAANTVLMRSLVFVPLLLGAVWLEEQGWGLVRAIGLVGVPELIFSVLILDAFDYLWHRGNHRVAFLWRFHKVHHSDRALDVTTALRFHLGSYCFRASLKPFGSRARSHPGGLVPLRGLGERLGSGLPLDLRQRPDPNVLALALGYPGLSRRSSPCGSSLGRSKFFHACARLGLAFSQFCRASGAAG